MIPFKNFVFTVVQVALWLTFFMGINDPGLVGQRPEKHIYNTYWFIVKPLYTISAYTLEPMKAGLKMIGLYDGQDATQGWFPYTTAAEFKEGLNGFFGLGEVVPNQLFDGAIVWWIPILSVILVIGSSVFDHVYERFRNWLWNVVVEYLFQRRKARTYKQMLEQRTTDIEKLNKQYTRLAQETYSLKDSVVTDELTQIYNKRFFLSRLQQEFDECKRNGHVLSLIMIDIDYFKRLNDTYGHVVGDQVLKSVATVMKRFVPERCYPCRYGGEEFSIIMPKKSVQEAVEAARLLQEHVQKLRFDQIDSKLRVTISQGVASVDFSNPQSINVKQFDVVLEAADKELYRSKVGGRNRVSVNVLAGHVNS